ncbi:MULTISPECIES: hypothetical protein [unclassified Frondihabitans]|uniref:hypothetical protein n=1 Tax=unclassified Frondihabitans TaxID=2626248 RepID=UPI000F4FC445|nr:MULTISPECIES: hypothetical protein [unclassified Frondihabitans]RPE77608.1 hypothetical protein EDF37_0255 [Frondihabitans sp. PhB153]RPF07885.1 hypothetical protein EDF39_0256 [Frondihabitans sp. PhB161]
MSDASEVSAFTTLQISEGDRVRLIGNAPNLFNDDRKPAGVTVTGLGSESAEVGVIVVDSEADLRERLFTELDGLKGAKRVWILSPSDSSEAPDADAISAEADVVSWSAAPSITVQGFIAVELTFNN